MGKWEYKVEKWQSALYETDNIEQKLNEYGREGWELVNIVPQISSSSNDNHQVEDVYIEFNALIFKRAK